MKEIIKDIINDINMSTFIIGIIEVLIGAILIKTTIGISTMLLILGGVNIGKRTIWWKGALKVKENSIKNKRSSIEEDIKELKEMIDSDIESVGGVEGFNNYYCANECITSWIDRVLDIVERMNEK